MMLSRPARQEKIYTLTLKQFSMLLRLDINLEVAAIILEDWMSTSPSLWGGMIEGEKNLAVKQDGTFSSYKS